MDDLTAALDSPSPEKITEETKSPLAGALNCWEPNDDRSEYSYPTTAPLRLSRRRSRNDDGFTDVLTADNSGSSVPCAPQSSNEGNPAILPTCPGIVVRQEQDIFSGSSGHRITASLHAAENGFWSELRETHDSASVGVCSFSTRFIQNSSLSPEGVFPHEGGEDDKRNVAHPCIEVLKQGGDSNFGGQGEGLGLSATTAFPVREVPLHQGQFQEVGTNDGWRTRARGDCVGQARLRRSLSRDADIERYKKGPPNIGLVHDIIDNLVEEFKPRPIYPGPSREPPSLGPQRSSFLAPRRWSPGMTMSSRPLGPGGGGGPSSSFGRNRDSIPPCPNIGSRFVTYPPDEDRDRDQIIERVWSACSLLESITGELASDKRLLYQSKSHRPTSKSEGAMVSAMTVSHEEIEDGSEYHDLEEQGTPAEMSPIERTWKRKARKGNLHGNPAKIPKSGELAQRSVGIFGQKNLKGGEEMCTYDSSEPEPERTLKLKERKAKLDGKPAEMPEGEGLLRRSSPSHSQKKLKHGEEHGQGAARFKKDSVDRSPTALDASNAPAVKPDTDTMSVNAQTPQRKPLTDMLNPSLAKKAAAEKRSKKATASEPKYLLDKHGGSPNADSPRTGSSDTGAAASVDVSNAWSKRSSGFVRRKAVTRGKKSPASPSNLLGKQTAATNGSSKVRSTKIKTATDLHGGQHAFAKKVPLENTSSQSVLHGDNSKPYKASERWAGKKSTAGINKKGEIYAALKPLTKAFAGKGAKKAVSGNKNTPKKQKSRSESAPKASSSDHNSTSSFESRGATQSKKSETTSLKKCGPTKKTTKKKGLTAHFENKDAIKKKLEADDSKFSDEDSHDAEAMKAHLLTSQGGGEVVTQDKKQFRSIPSKSSKKVEQEPSEGDSRVRKAVDRRTASGKVNAIERESCAKIGDKETKLPKWMTDAAYHDEPETTNIKGDVEKGGRGHLPSGQAEPETEAEERKQERMRAHTDAGADRKDSSETSEYESFSRESDLLDDKEFLLEPSTLRENQKFPPDLGGGLGTSTAKSNVLQDEKGTVSEGNADRKSSFAINGDSSNDGAKTTPLKGLQKIALDNADELGRPFSFSIGRSGQAEKPDGEAGSQHDATALIYIRSIASRSSEPLAKVGIYMHKKRTQKGGVSRSQSLNYEPKRMTRPFSTEWRIPRSSSLSMAQPDPRPSFWRGRLRGSHSFQWIANHATSRSYAPIRSRTCRTMPQGPPGMVSQFYARKPLPRRGLPCPSSSAQYYGATAGVDSSESLLFNPQMQPLPAFFPSPGFVTRRFRTPEGAEVVVSLHADSQPALPLEAQEVPTKAPEMIQGACFSNFACIDALSQNAKIGFRGASIAGPSGYFRSPTIAAAPKTFNVQPLQPLVMHGATPKPVTSLAAANADQKRARPVASVDIKQSSTFGNSDMFHTLSDSEESSSLSPTSNMTYSIQTHLTTDGEEQASFRSTDKIIPTGENRWRGDFVKTFYNRASVIVYVVLVLGALAGITEGFVGYVGRYAAPSLLSDITDSDDDVTGTREDPWAFSTWAQGAAPLSAKEDCRSPWCSEQLLALNRSLNAAVRPCQDFYDHVCSQSPLGNATSAKQLAQLTEQRMVGSFRRTVKPGREAQVLRASRRLWKGCVDVNTLKRLGNVPLQDLLTRTGLGGWPYNRDDALPDVWEAAGKLQRLMDIAPLVEVNVRPDNTLRLSHGYLNSTVGSDDVLGAMRIIRPDSSRLGQLAEDVAAFGHKITVLVNSHEEVISDHRLSDAYLVLRTFLQEALEGLRPDAAAVRTELGNFIDPVVQLVRETRPETVLNLLGYLLVRHVDLFTLPVVTAHLESGQLTIRRSRCTRVVLEGALTAEAADDVRYAALQTQLDYDAILSVETDLKRVLSAKLASLPWMDNQTRKMAQRRLRDLKVRLTFGRYEESDGSAPVFPPEALPSQALATYQVFREARFKSRMLHFDAVKDNATDPDCTHDAKEEVLYLRLSSAVETHDTRSPLWPLLQAARLAPMLSRCMLRVLLLPETPSHREAQHRGNGFSAAGSARFDGLSACLRAQHTLGRSASTGRARDGLAAIQSAALEPARNAYDAYVVRLARETPVEQLIGSHDTRTPLGWNQLFYVAYARSLCESPDRPGLAELRTPQREMVNGPLSNDRDFHRAFNCLRGEAMRPEPTCHFWNSPTI